MLLDVTPSSFQVKRLDSLISTTRFSLFDYIASTRVALEEEESTLAGRIQTIESKLFRLPKSEREFLAIERRLAISDKFYGYLLEQRATNLIARAAITSNASIIEACACGWASPDPTSPKPSATTPSLVWPSPLAWPFSGFFLFERIESVNELREATSLPGEWWRPPLRGHHRQTIRPRGLQEPTAPHHRSFPGVEDQPPIPAQPRRAEHRARQQHAPW